MDNCDNQDLKVKTWQAILESEHDRPKQSVVMQNTMLRYVMGPIITAIVVGLVLVIISPPFVCGNAPSRLATPKISWVRILVWMAIAAALFLLFPIFRVSHVS